MAIPLADRVQEDRRNRAAARKPASRPRILAVLDIIGAVFFALGWAAGALVSIIRYVWGAARYGYRQGRALVPDPPAPAPQTGSG